MRNKSNVKNIEKLLKSNIQFGSKFQELEEKSSQNTEDITNLVKAVEKLGEVKSQFAIAKLIAAEQKMIKEKFLRK
jgi:hypothetical protein